MSSPKYQTVPSWSWAYQSRVSSASLPFTNSWSLTTVAVTPSICLVSCATVTTSTAASPPSLPLYL